MAEGPFGILLSPNTVVLALRILRVPLNSVDLRAPRFGTAVVVTLLGDRSSDPRYFVLSGCVFLLRRACASN